MSEVQEKTREQLMSVVNDIIFMAHRIRRPSNRVKEIFVDQILRMEELRTYFEREESCVQRVKSNDD